MNSFNNLQSSANIKVIKSIINKWAWHLARIGELIIARNHFKELGVSEEYLIIFCLFNGTVNCVESIKTGN